jgi:predicted ribosome quality control (RQC) complex YloA/Tae2 family protein
MEQLIALLDVADEREQIDQIAAEAEEQGFLAPSDKLKSGKKKRPPARRKPLHLVSSDGFDIYVGRSGVQNDEVTFRIGRPDDLWLHVRTIPGAHVIVRSRGGDVPARTLHEAAGVAAYFSGARTEASVDVEISRRRQVRKIRGAPPGLVTYRAEQTIRVPPLPPWG